MLSDLLKGSLAPRIAPSYRLVKTDFEGAIGWCHGGLSDMDLFEKAVLSLHLREESLPVIGSMARGLLRKVSRGSTRSEWIKELLGSQGLLELQLSSQMTVLAEILSSCLKGNLDGFAVSEARRLLGNLVPLDPLVKSHFREIQEDLLGSYPSPLHFFGQLRRRFDRIGRRIELRKKLIVHLMEELNENIIGEKTQRSPDAP